MENTNVEQTESNVIVISRTLVTANPRKLELFNVSYPEVYEATQDYFSTAKVVDPLGATVLTADGKINDHYQMTERGFQSLCTYIGVNANTVKAFWELDPEKTSNMMCQRINAVKKSKRIRYLTHGDTIEGFATDWYGEVPTTTVLESYNEINPDVNYTRVAFDGLRSRFTTLAPDAESIEPAVGDIIKVGQDFMNSQDGSMSFFISFILFRLVCSNGMIVGGKGLESKVVHRGNQALDKSIESLSIDNLDLETLTQRLVQSRDIIIGEDRMEALFNKCAKISKKYAKKVVQEFDHPTCPSAKQGFTLYDFWNAATHQAKFMGDRQRETEKFAFQILNAKLPEETNPERARTEISD